MESWPDALRWPKMAYGCAQGHRWWLLSASGPLPHEMPCPFCGDSPRSGGRVAGADSGDE